MDSIDPKALRDTHNQITDRIVYDIIGNVTGIDIAFADPFLADVSLYISYEDEREVWDKYVEKMREMFAEYGIDAETADYLLEMNFSIIALAIMMHRTK